MERPRNNGESRYTDEELIDQHIAGVEALEAEPVDKNITDAAARVIASLYHPGMGSKLYMLASTGRCDDTYAEVEREYYGYHNDAISQKRLMWLLLYISARETNGTAANEVEGWHTLWLDQPGGEV